MSYKEFHVLNWACARNITGPTGQATQESQLNKLREEVEEIAVEVATGDTEALASEIGDAYVVLCLLANTSGLSLDECIDKAWDKIKDRTGMMIQGTFVKQSNLDTLRAGGFRTARGRLVAPAFTPDERDAAVSLAVANNLNPQSSWLSGLKVWEVSV